MKLTDFTTLNSFCPSFYKLETKRTDPPIQSRQELKLPLHFAKLDDAPSFSFFASEMYPRSAQKPISKVLQRGSLAKHFGFLKLARRLAAVIDPVCQNYKLGASVTPDCLRLSVRQVRIKDENPYAINPDEDPRDLIKEVLLLEVGLPNPLFVRRFTMFQPSVEKALAEKGFGAMKVKPVIDRCGLHPQPFLFTETGPSIGGPGAVEGAKELSDRLPESSPLKEAMAKLAATLEEHQDHGRR